MIFYVNDKYHTSIHIFTVIKFLFNLGVRFNYIPKYKGKLIFDYLNYYTLYTRTLLSNTLLTLI